MIVSVAEAELADVAVMVAEPAAVAVTLKVPDVEPCGIVIDAGTVADAEALARATMTPPTGAALDSVTVPVAD